MAEVRLGRFEIENRKLPALCMCCGAPATVWVDRAFSWRSSAFQPLKKMTVSVPLCRRHRNHWTWLVWLNSLFVLLVVLLIPGSFASVILLPDIDFDVIAGALCGGSILLALTVIVVKVVFDLKLIKPKEITESSISLDRHLYQSWRVWLNLAFVLLVGYLILGSFAMAIWMLKSEVILGSFATAILMPISEVIMASLCWGSILLAPTIFMANAIFDRTLNKPKENTEGSILLERVSEKFAEALEKMKALPDKE